MKVLVSQMMAILRQPVMRRNLGALVPLVLVLIGFVALYSILFHVLMLREGQEHTWLTGVYWTLTVMSTLGFGDITFHTDLGRLFSLLVLLTGLILLLIVLPFAFIRHFYAPWMEAQLRLKAPRELPPDVHGHVVICALDGVGRALIRRLELLQESYVVLEEDPVRALDHHSEGIQVVQRPMDMVRTWEVVRAHQAQLVVINLSDAENTNITLTIREHAPNVPLVALVDDKDAVDILELAGADHVFALKHRLGEHLASHTEFGTTCAHHVGQVDALVVAELAVRRTALAGSSLRESGLRASTGVNVLAVWERGVLRPAHADLVLTRDHVALVAGSEDQVRKLDELHTRASRTDAPVVILGGGKVGRAAARALKKQGQTVYVVDRDERLRPLLEKMSDRVVIGDGADIDVMQAVEIERASSVLLTTHEDATNVYLTLYARRLNPDCQIVSRVTYEHNLEAVHRAGANFVLSESGLGAKLVMSVIQKRRVLVIGEEVDILFAPLPAKLAGVPLRESGIGSETGLVVVGIRRDGVTEAITSADVPLEADATLVLLGTHAQHAAFRDRFGG